VSKKRKRAISNAGEEANRNIATTGRIADLVRHIKDAIEQIETVELDIARDSATRILDILTVLENHAFIASTDSTFLIELFGHLEPDMIQTIAEHMTTEQIAHWQQAIEQAANTDSRRGGRE